MFDTHSNGTCAKHSSLARPGTSQALDTGTSQTGDRHRPHLSLHQIRAYRRDHPTSLPSRRPACSVLCVGYGFGTPCQEEYPVRSPCTPSSLPSATPGKGRRNPFSSCSGRSCRYNVPRGSICHIRYMHPRVSHVFHIWFRFHIKPAMHTVGCLEWIRKGQY